MTIYLRVVLAAVLYCNGLLFSQIAITEADFAATIEVGDTLRSFSEGDFTLVDIGSPGATSWDFSELNADSSSSDFFSVDPSSTPFIADFPEASHAFQLTIEVQVREFDFFCIICYNHLPSRFSAALQ